MLPLVLLVLGVAGLLTWILTPATIRLAQHWGIVDRPGGRRQHVGVIPRLGGLAIFAGFIGANGLVRGMPEGWRPPTSDPQELFRWTGLMLGATFVTVFGLLDDRYHFRSGPQYVAQMMAAGIALYFTIFIERVNNPFGPGQIVFPWPMVWVFTLFWFLGFINTVNFLDGVDGLASSVAGVVAVVLALHMFRTGQASVAWIPLALLGSVLGFLRFNWPPARVFMGSSGSYFLGFTLASLGLIAGARVATVLLVMGLPIMDVAWLIWWRWRHGRPLFQGDRNHLHFRLLDRGYSARQIVLAYVAFGAVFGMIGLMTARTWAKILALLALFVVSAGVILWASREDDTTCDEIDNPERTL